MQVREASLIYIQATDARFDAVRCQYPARHYVMVDEKLRVLDAMKKITQERLTTVLPRQGHYALDPANIATFPAADVAVECIGEPVDFDIHTMITPKVPAHASKEK